MIAKKKEFAIRDILSTLYFLLYTVSMRYLGIDYGSKRVGIAISDPEKKFAFPLIVLDNNHETLEDIVELCRDNSVEAIVVGESKDFNQKDNKIMEEIKPFVEALKAELKFPIYMHPEFFTSMEAERVQGKNHMHDASAAALILTSFLGSINNESIL
ncbi:MAG: RuvX/YqgF family protein [Minisyncoccia bacterium]